MTFKEKLMQEHPEDAMTDEFPWCAKFCLIFYKYESRSSSLDYCFKEGANCEDCWDREMEA